MYRAKYGKDPVTSGTWGSMPTGLTGKQAAEAMMKNVEASGGNETAAFTQSHSIPQESLTSYAGVAKKQGVEFDPNFVASGKWDKWVDLATAARRAGTAVPKLSEV